MAVTKSSRGRTNSLIVMADLSVAAQAPDWVMEDRRSDKERFSKMNYSNGSQFASFSGEVFVMEWIKDGSRGKERILTFYAKDVA